MMFVDDAGTLGYAEFNDATNTRTFSSFRPETLWVSSRAPTRAWRVPPGRPQPISIDRSYKPSTDSTPRRTTIRRHQTNALLSGCWAPSRSALARRFYMEGLLHNERQSSRSRRRRIWSNLFHSRTSRTGRRDPSGQLLQSLRSRSVDPPGPPATRRLVEAGNRAVSEDVDLWRVLVGLEGAAGADWRWQVSAGAPSPTPPGRAGFMRVRFSLGSRAIRTGRVRSHRLRPTGRGDRRVPAASIVPGCVPLNLFGGPAASRRTRSTT